MGSKIEWTERTWNPTVGCTRASAGCDNCYAVTMTKRLAAMGQAKYDGLVNAGKGHFNGVVRTVPEALPIPLKRKTPTVWFVNSMSDLFHKDVPFDFIDKVFAVMALCPQHTFQVLTKRPERMAAYLTTSGCGDDERSDDVAAEALDLRDQCHLAATDEHCLIQPDRWPLPNVWLGTSVENQQTADERIPHLLKCPAAVRFLSCEPLLGVVDLWGARYANPNGGETGAVTSWAGGVDWVIVGGESGSGARPMHPDWARSLRDQCQAAGVAYFFKQWGEWQGADCGHPKDGWQTIGMSGRLLSMMPSADDANEEPRRVVRRVGKKVSGRRLDGRTWDQLPEEAEQ